MKVSFVESSYQHVLEDARDLLQEVQLLIIADSTDATRKASLSRLAHGIQRALADFHADRGAISSLEGAIALSRPIIEDMKLHKEIMEELYVECLIERGRIESAAGMSISLPSLWEFSEENDLLAKLRELKEQYGKAADDAYIRYALDAVMMKHGYNVSKSVCLANSVNANHQMFLSEGSDVGIHTYMAPNGMIMMETAAIDDSIRNAEDGARVERSQAQTSYDRIRLVEQQVSFCELHPELLADLAEYGVVSCVKSDNEPSEEHSIMFSAIGAVAQTSEAQQQVRRSRREETTLQEREMR